MKAVMILTQDGKYTGWSQVKKTLNEPRFTTYLANFNVDVVPRMVRMKLRQLINESDDFSPEAIAKSQRAVRGFSNWIVAVNNYCQMMRDVKLMRVQMEQKEANVAQMSQQLVEKVEQYNKVVE